MGWGSESQEEGEPAPGRVGGIWASQSQASLSLLCFPWGAYYTGKISNVSPSAV